MLRFVCSGIAPLVVLSLLALPVDAQNNPFDSILKGLNEAVKKLPQDEPQNQPQTQPQAPAGQHPATMSAPPPNPQAAPRANRFQILNVQRKLNALGYDAGTADGTMGTRTRAAIQKFERDRGLPVTGEVTPALMAALRHGGPAQQATSSGQGAQPGSPSGGSPPLSQSQGRTAGPGGSPGLTPGQAAGRDPRAELAKTPWLHGWRMMLLGLRDKIDELSPATKWVNNATIRQITVEQRRWKVIDAQTAQKRRRYVALEWQTAERTRPALARGALLDVFLSRDADWSFFEREPNYKPSYRSDTERLMWAEVKTEPEAFLFSRKAVEGHLTEFIKENLGPVFLRHLKLAVARVPTRLKFEVPLSVEKYDFDQRAILISAPGLGDGQFMVELKPKDSSARIPDRVIYGWDTVNKRRANRVTKPGDYERTPTPEWRGLFDDRRSPLALDRILVLQPIRMDPSQAEALIKSMRERNGQKLRAYVIVDIQRGVRKVAYKDKRGYSQKDTAFLANLVGVRIFDRNKNLFASYDASTFPTAGQLLGEKKAQEIAAKQAKEQARLEAEKKAALAAKKAKAAAMKDLDIVGLKIGMPLAEAEKRIAEIFKGKHHTYFTKSMAQFASDGSYSLNQTGQSYDARRLYHGKLFTSFDFKQQIAVYINPTTANQEVIAVGRLVVFDQPLPDASVLMNPLTKKYGKPDTNRLEWFQSPDTSRFCSIHDTVDVNFPALAWLGQDGKALEYSLRKLQMSRAPVLSIQYFGLNKINNGSCEDVLAARIDPRYLMVWMTNPDKGAATYQALQEAITKASEDRVKEMGNKLKL